MYTTYNVYFTEYWTILLQVLRCNANIIYFKKLSLKTFLTKKTSTSETLNLENLSLKGFLYFYLVYSNVYSPTRKSLLFGRTETLRSIKNCLPSHCRSRPSWSRPPDRRLPSVLSRSAVASDVFAGRISLTRKRCLG